MSNSFIPDNHEIPSNEGGYTRLADGDNKFRILSNPLIVYTLWADGKPSRVRFDPNNKPQKPAGQNSSVRYAWIMKVWNYQTENVEVMELTQKTLLNPLFNHAKDEDWGHPKDYDVVFNKSGSGKEGTTYLFTAKPKKPLTAEILAAVAEVPVDLEQLLIDGGDPFIKNGNSAPAAQAKSNPAPQQNNQSGSQPPF